MFQARIKVSINSAGEVVTAGPDGSEVVLAKQEEAYEYLLAHVQPKELPAVKKFCQVSKMRSQLA